MIDSISYPALYLVVAIVLSLIFIVIKNRNRAIWGFKDVVKNPQYWADVDLAREKVERRAKEAMSWDDAKVASLTKEFILEAKSSRDAWEEARILEALGERAHPATLTLLRNPALYGQLVIPTGTNLVPEAPFNRACDILGDSPGAEAVEALAPFLADPSKGIRRMLPWPLQRQERQQSARLSGGHWGIRTNMSAPTR